MPQTAVQVYFTAMPLNYEFKARTNCLAQLEADIQKYASIFVGTDHQFDTYFQVPMGRLKLREGRIENALIHYLRPDDSGAKVSQVLLYQHGPDPALKEILTAALGIKVVVEKKRRIYFIDNVKFHFDEVAGLGSFVEVEAIDKEGLIGMNTLKEQCDTYARLFALQPDDYVSHSYSDLLLAALLKEEGLAAK